MGAGKNSHSYDAIIIGGGAAGLGVAIALRHAGVENIVVLERHMVGASFALWPDETRFITPSFPSNSVGMLDLNSIAIGVSPAYSLEVEHPTGKQYAAHLQGIAKFFEVPIQEETSVLRVTNVGDDFRVDTADETLRARHVVWAAGEFQYPQLKGFDGSELCTHTSLVQSYSKLAGDEFIVIGGYESGVDAAYHLAYRNVKVMLFDSGCPWKEESSDPSVALSIYSQQRMREKCFLESVELYPETTIQSVALENELYEVTTQDNQLFRIKSPPLLAGGFDGSHRLVADLFEQRSDGFPLLNEHDESTIVPGLFLCGPAVRHDNHVFCFIYKYRQRFAVVAKAIATSLGLPADELEKYRQWGMYLDDLSCCGEECAAC